MNYELTYLISPDLDEKAVEELAKSIEETISKQGKIIKTESPKKIKLSYTIKKQVEAFLAVVEFTAEPEKANQFKIDLEKNTQILRFLIIKKPITKKLDATPKKPFKEISNESKTKDKETEPKKLKESPKEKVELSEIEKKLEELL